MKMARSVRYDGELARRIVGEFYETKGFKYCMARIPGATRKDVQNVASRMGKKMSKEVAAAERRERANKRWKEIDDDIKVVYHRDGIDACHKHLAVKFNVKLTRKALQSRASKLGVRMSAEAYAASREGVGGPAPAARTAQPVTEPTGLTRLEKLALCGGKRKPERYNTLLEDPAIWRRI